MLVYEPRSVRLAFKLVKCQNLPAEFETLTVNDIERGVIEGDFNVVNAIGEYDPEGSHHVVHVATQVKVAHIEAAYELEGDKEGTWRWV